MIPLEYLTEFVIATFLLGAWVGYRTDKRK